jgi:flavin-dependent dehydrogenase
MHTERFDIIIIGGGIAGALMGVSLKRKAPEMHVAIVEQQAKFDIKVGESTSDITTLYLRQLKLDHLLKKHPYKAGLRFLFNENNSTDIEEVSEFNSPTLKSSIGGRHLNRQLFDEDLLNEAKNLGCVIFRPARITSSELHPFDYTLILKMNGNTVQINASKLLDASGRARFLPKTLGWKDLPLQLKNAAVFARFKHPTGNLRLKTKTAQFWNDKAVNDIEYGTTHFMRKHAWFWLIKLSKNEYSVGLVLDTQYHTVVNPEAYFSQQIAEEPLLASFLQGSEVGKLTYIPQLSYCAEKLFEDGAAVIGDSGAFTDPFISPGLEMICQQAASLTDLYIHDYSKGKFHENNWKKYERVFLSSYQSRDGIYSHWYSIMHRYDLLTNWMRVSLLVYFGLYVNPAYAFPKRLRVPVRSTGLSKLGVRIFMGRIRAMGRKLECKSNGLPTPARTGYSGVRIANGLQLFSLPVLLGFRWLKDYLVLEWKYFTNR